MKKMLKLLDGYTVGSIGKNTAVPHMSDMDVLVPLGKRHRDEQENGMSDSKDAVGRLANRVRDILSDHVQQDRTLTVEITYPSVTVKSEKFNVDILPAYVDAEDDDFWAVPSTWKPGHWFWDNPGKQVKMLDQAEALLPNLRKVIREVKRIAKHHHLKVKGFVLECAMVQFASDNAFVRHWETNQKRNLAKRGLQTCAMQFVRRLVSETDIRDMSTGEQLDVDRGAHNELLSVISKLYDSSWHTARVALFLFYISLVLLFVVFPCFTEWNELKNGRLRRHCLSFAGSRGRTPCSSGLVHSVGQEVKTGVVEKTDHDHEPQHAEDLVAEGGLVLLILRLFLVEVVLDFRGHVVVSVFIPSRVILGGYAPLGVCVLGHHVGNVREKAEIRRFATIFVQVDVFRKVVLGDKSLDHGPLAVDEVKLVADTVDVDSFRVDLAIDDISPLDWGQ
jgi:hypothetical protein